MTPQAHLASAVEIMDLIISGEAPEKVLSNWSRRSRFAGSGDREKIRNIVFDCLRSLKSFWALGQAETGRGVVIGYLLASDRNPEEVFTGLGYAPGVLSEEELKRLEDSRGSSKSDGVIDLPDWLLEEFRGALKSDFNNILEMFRFRAPLYLRVNRSRTSPEETQKTLESEGVSTTRHPSFPFALEVLTNERKVKKSKTLELGHIELQDLNSQAVCETIPLKDGFRVLDFCAGGGGKSLALADRFSGEIFAFDANFKRMQDIPVRANRAGSNIKVISELELESEPKFDIVMCDVPCTGSGSWRRDPNGKWSLTPERYQELMASQKEILTTAKDHVKDRGLLVYITCSLLPSENSAQVNSFLDKFPNWTIELEKSFSPLTGGDGFFTTHLRLT